MTQLPSEHQIGEVVWLTLWAKWLPVRIISVKFSQSHIRYDIEMFAYDGSMTRLYNVDEKHLKKRKEKIQLVQKLHILPKMEKLTKLYSTILMRLLLLVIERVPTKLLNLGYGQIRSPKSI